jgi:hypothetical protein
MREVLVEAMTAVREGKLPLDTAKEIHLLGHRVVMDKFAEVRLRRLIREEEYEKAKALIKALTNG